jgi:hypothetical protein
LVIFLLLLLLLILIPILIRAMGKERIARDNLAKKMM